jgi:murein DD-endopeptidase MepM/ murein hydrolase activator NlpD
VQHGETLFSISRRYGLTVDAVSRANGIADPRKIFAGQRLIIPGRAEPVDEEGTTAYVVPAGDSLLAIARRYRTTWQTLVELNRLMSPNVVHAGQVIRVPVPDRIAGTDAGLGDGRSGISYIVRPGDTLYSIALRYGISSWSLAAASQVGNPALVYVGQELMVPGEGSGLLPEPFGFVDVRPMPANQGTTMVVSVRTTEPVTLEGRLFERQVWFGEENGVYYGVVGVHVFCEPGLYSLELTAVDGQSRVTTISTGIIIEPERTRYERIDVPANRSDLLDPGVVSAEQERLSGVVATFSPQRRWGSAMQQPAVGTVSSYFGTHRSYDGGPYTSYHSGTDLRAPTGTPVYASAGGRVILAEQLMIHGNMVVVDHGWGVVTGYAHLSTIDVQVGQEVAVGDLLGKVGNTGRSTGAHLHWEVWIGGISVDGLQWLREFYPWAGDGPAEGG